MNLGEKHRQNKQTNIDLIDKAERKVQYKVLKYAMRDITKFINQGAVNPSITLYPSFFKYNYDRLLYEWFRRNKLKVQISKLDDGVSNTPIVYNIKVLD